MTWGAWYHGIYRQCYLCLQELAASWSLLAFYHVPPTIHTHLKTSSAALQIQWFPQIPEDPLLHPHSSSLAKLSMDYLCSSTERIQRNSNGQYPNCLWKDKGWKKLMFTLPPHCCWVGNVGLNAVNKVAEITCVLLPGLEGNADVTGVTPWLQAMVRMARFPVIDERISAKDNLISIKH